MKTWKYLKYHKNVIYRLYKHKESIFMMGMRSPKERPLPFHLINDEVNDSVVKHVVYVAHTLKVHLRINRTNCLVCI